MDRSEEREQARLIKWTHLRVIRELMPNLAYLHHSPNGGKRDAFTGAQMKALGVKPGFPDLILPARATPPLPFYGLAIEMKRPDGKGKTSDKQDDWLNHFAGQGWMAVVCTTAEDAARALAIYHGINLDSLPCLP